MKEKLFDFLDTQRDKIEQIQCNCKWEEFASIEYGKYNVYFHKDFIAITEIPSWLFSKLGINNLQTFYISAKETDSINLELFWNYLKPTRLYLKNPGEIKIVGNLSTSKELFSTGKGKSKYLIELTIQTKIDTIELTRRFENKNIEIKNWC